jgi:hypothetical protein
MSPLISNLLSSLIGLAGGLIAAVLVYKFSRQQARESWLRTYKELHEFFWSDSDFQEIRAWLACNRSYAKIQPILEKRQLIAKEHGLSDSLSEEEYKMLERLDRFLNFLLRVIVINPDFKRRKDLWDKLYFQYWLDQFYHPNRPELRWYFEEFYEEIYKTEGVLPIESKEIKKLPPKDEPQHNNSFNRTRS